MKLMNSVLFFYCFPMCALKNSSLYVCFFACVSYTSKGANKVSYSVYRENEFDICSDLGSS